MKIFEEPPIAKNLLNEVVGFVIICNTIGNLFGWGGFLCLLLKFELPAFVIGLFILPFLVPSILFLNFLLAVILVVILVFAKLRMVPLPSILLSRKFIIFGVVSAILFYAGSILYASFWFNSWSMRGLIPGIHDVND